MLIGGMLFQDSQNGLAVTSFKGTQHLSINDFSSHRNHFLSQQLALSWQIQSLAFLFDLMSY